MSMTIIFSKGGSFIYSLIYSSNKQQYMANSVPDIVHIMRNRELMQDKVPDLEPGSSEGENMQQRNDSPRVNDRSITIEEL